MCEFCSPLYPGQCSVCRSYLDADGSCPAERRAAAIAPESPVPGREVYSEVLLSRRAELAAMTILGSGLAFLALVAVAALIG